MVIPVWDCTLGTLVSCLDTTLRRLGGAPTYVLTDNVKTVTVERIAGIAVRHPQTVAAGRYYGCQVESCVPYDPESNGGAEATARIAKADLVPTEANLRGQYASFAELAAACETWCEQVNNRRHRSTGQIPVDRLHVERRLLHRLPDEPLALALGEERLVGDDQTVSLASVHYSTQPGHVGTKVWCRVVGDKLVVTARQGTDLVEVVRHQVSTPGLRGSWTSTTRTIPEAEASTSPVRSRGPRPRSRSSRSVRAPSGGCWRPDRPEPSGSARRWPARSSSRPWSEPTWSTGPLARRPSTAASTTTTSRPFGRDHRGRRHRPCGRGPLRPARYRRLGGPGTTPGLTAVSRR
ncbi:hypothetical protein ACIHFE_29935 [Streptomyces sp. NPDC052396]|uniref:hypothetical protein n=1 Tax=Streptomyces sp. NPDC052396 TaxID=3365689 RepID=UPI0037D3547E